MQIEKKRLKSGFELPVFGFGTWTVGGGETRDPDNDDMADINAIKTAIEMGITHIDTAEMYSEGHAEELVGEAIKGFDRSSLIIATKVWHTNLRYDDLINSAQKSLKRLGTDYADIYIIHYPNPSDIKYIGLSNFSVGQFREAQKHTENKIVCNQLYYNLANREPAKDGFLEYAQENDVMLVAWKPIEYGIFSRTKDSILKKLCKKYGKTGNQIAINWLISQDNVATISKSRNINHLKENLDALDWKLDKSDVKLLTDKFRG